MIRNVLLQYFSVIKPYYPFFMASDYSPLDYSPYYHYRSTKLRIDKPNIHQICYTTLPKFLEQQIEEDKTIFFKQKQFLFVGRSNSGKSSIINQIFKTAQMKTKKKIARVAKRPGTTKFLHFHHIENQNSKIVDAPGYGFAKMNKHRREMWFGLAEEYMKVSSRLSQIFICINFEHGLKANDEIFLKRADQFNIDLQLILTKTDKVRENKYFIQLQSIVEGVKRLELKNLNERVIACSSKNNFGIEILRMRIIEAIEKSKQRNIDYKQDLLLSYVKSLRVQPAKLQEAQKTQSKPFLLRKLIYNSKLTKYIK